MSLLFMTEKEYNDCLTLYADNVYRFIVKNLRHKEDARDVVQATFEKLWKSREAVEISKSKANLFTIAYHLMIDHVRKIKKVQLTESRKRKQRTAHWRSSR